MYQKDNGYILINVRQKILRVTIRILELHEGDKQDNKGNKGNKKLLLVKTIFLRSYIVLIEDLSD